MKNTLGDLNNYLFEQLERLTDDELDGEDLAVEISRSRAVTGIASQIIQNGNLVLRASIAQDERMDANARMPRMLKGAD